MKRNILHFFKLTNYTVIFGQVVLGVEESSAYKLVNILHWKPSGTSKQLTTNPLHIVAGIWTQNLMDERWATVSLQKT